MENDLEKIDTNLTKEQLENAKEVNEKCNKIIEKHLGKDFPMEYRAILLISYIFTNGNSDDDFEKKVILLKKLINEDLESEGE